MKRTVMILTTMSIVLLATTMAEAQRQGRRGRGGFSAAAGLLMLRATELQDELGLADEQKSELGAIMSEQFSAFRELSGLDEEERQEAIQEILADARAELKVLFSEDQMKRFEEIELQQQGGEALAREKITKKLKLSDEQIETIKEIIAQTGQARGDLFAQLREGGDREAVMTKVRELRKERDDKVVAVLSADQKKQWTAMLGEHFDMPPQRGFGGGGRRGGGQRSGRQRSGEPDRQ